MTLVKIHVIAVITAIVVIATATTMTGFPSVSTVFATPLTFGPPEQVGNDTTTDTTTTTQPPVGQQQQTIHITKDGTNSYVISGSSSSVGSFDTTYRVVGETSAIRASEDLIIATIISDFSTSLTIGYVMVGNTTTATAGAADGTTLPNPFATPEQITERITSDLRRVIGEAENNTSQGQHVEIKCEFGMTLEDMRCHYIPLVGGGAGTLLTTAPTNTTAPTTPLEGE
ncbi:MAG: hypothetical protein QOK66_04700 [Nitrososphaeraceae archaeon]|nr:hypothetical protein [Nitrososphaeraceae archaeon]